MREAPSRVLYVENGIGYGGAVICLRHLVRNLDRLRFEPIVVTGRGGPPYEEIAREAVWYHIPDRHVDIVGVRRRLDKIAWLKQIPGARSLAGQVLARTDDAMNFVPFFLGLWKVAARHRPVIIHANNEPLCNRAALLVGRLLRIPVVCHVRGEQHGSRMMHWLYSLPVHFIPVSRWISDRVGKLGIPMSKRTCIYDGIDLDKLDAAAKGDAFRKAHGIPPDGFAVGLVGLLIPWKGQPLFLEAGRMLLGQIPNLYLFVVGGTPPDCKAYEAELRAHAGKSEFGGRVIFTGHVAEMPSVYRALDVVVSASTSPEPLGTVVIEALALGRPIVAPSHGGAVEMIEHDETGLLFEPLNAVSLAAAIKRIHAEPDLGPRMGSAARRRALATFSAAEHTRRVQEIYDQVLAGRRAGATAGNNGTAARDEGA